MKKTKMLKKNYEFKNVLTKGKKYFGKYIIIYIQKNNINSNKLGIAISKKSANSVHRNKIKRLIRENYRLMESSIKSGYNFVIMWNKNAKIEDAQFYSIKKDIKYLFEKAEIFEDNLN